MVLNDAGMMIEKCWCELLNRFNNIDLGNYIIMPNHMHGIISIVGAPLVGAQINKQLNVEPCEQFHIKSHDRQSNINANEKSYKKISDYIINKPVNWLEDRFYE